MSTTQELEWTYIDKSKWPEGQWNQEPGSGLQVTREIASGLSKREWIAVHILSSVARFSVESRQLEANPQLIHQMDEIMVNASLVLTDKLIAQLSKTEKL